MVGVVLGVVLGVVVGVVLGVEVGHVDESAGAEKFRYIHQLTWPTSPGCKYWHPAPLHRNASKPSHPGEQEYGQLPVHLDEQSYFASPTTTCERSGIKIAPRRIKEGNMCSI